jgi:hypothetical protein
MHGYTPVEVGLDQIFRWPGNLKIGWPVDSVQQLTSSKGIP